jgi:hypothetical protein
VWLPATGSIAAVSRKIVTIAAAQGQCTGVNDPKGTKYAGEVDFADCAFP